MKRHYKRRFDLTFDDKVDIIHRALVKMENHDTIGKNYNMKQCHISTLVRKAKKNPRFLEELATQESLKESK